MDEHGVVSKDSYEQPEVTAKESNEYVLCYLSCPQDASNAFLGSLMLTDSRTRPLHFGFVSPVRPTAVQRLLYGPTLLEHVKIDVIAYKLFQGLPRRPDAVFVDSRDLLAARRLAPCPMAYLAKKDGGETDPTSLSALIYDTDQETNDQEIVGQIIASLESVVDLVEPFTRMIEALKEAVKGGTK